MMCELSRSTDDWLGRAVMWRNEQLASPPNLTDQLKACPQLAAYLLHLRQFIQNCDTVDEIMQRLPVIGQLLGRLCSLPAVLQHNEVCIALLGCLIGFCRPTTSHLSSLLEQKARTWAVNQIRSIVGGSDTSSHHLSGFPPHRFYVQSQTLMEQCLPGHDIHPTFGQLSTVMQQDELIMTHLRDMQTHPYTGHVSPLSPGCLQALWKWDVACLEHEILDMTTAAARIPHHDDKQQWEQLADTINSRHLPAVLSAFPPFWLTTHHLLLTVWNKTGHDAVRKLLVLLTSLLPPSLQASCTSSKPQILPGFSPRKLTVASCSHLLHLVAQTCSEEAWESTWLMLHPQWWTALTLLPLITDSQVCSDCSQVLCCSIGSSHQSCIQDFLDGLRGLLHKSTITVQDIQCVVPSTLPTYLTSHCLSVLLLLATHVPHQTTAYILQQVSDTDPTAILAETTKLLLEHSPLQAVDPERIQHRSTDIQQQVQGKCDAIRDEKHESEDVTDALWDSGPDDLWDS